jgi:predicted Rossmann-fold nucleotide-binding protein
MALLAQTTVGVIGSGSEPRHVLAAEVGALLAELGVHPLTGGGGGVMAAVSRAFRSARGLTVGSASG